ncbi:MAG: phytoene desaturase family protein [Longimicrobiales bacterium]|jgi:phytoene dehydrogenase-like protein
MSHDAVVVGAGPNGLAAAIELQRNGVSVLLLEANHTVGGAARTEELTLPGFKHDVGSSVYPLGIGSPFFASLPLAKHGLEWVHPDLPLAHPLDGGRAATLERDLESTARSLGGDYAAYMRFVGDFVTEWPTFIEHVLDRPTRLPRAPRLMARFGAVALSSTTTIGRRFKTEEGKALLAGNAAHSGVELEAAFGGAVATTLMAAGHAVGWPFPKGGAGALTAALASYFLSLGGKIETGRRVASLNDLPAAKATLLGLTNGQIGHLAYDRLSPRKRANLAGWTYGQGAFKVDWALDGPIPWENADVRRAGTVHVGGTFEDIRAAEWDVTRNKMNNRPFLLLAQHTLFDPSRAPEGKHTVWAYCHAPSRAQGEAGERFVLEAMEAQIERFAPGFRDLILGRAVHTPYQLETWNENLRGGDPNGGALTINNVLSPARLSRRPWHLPLKNFYRCSASAPPGGGVHGMVGYHAARAALRDTFGVR